VSKTRPANPRRLTEFPYFSLGDEEEVALCPVVVEILAQYGIAPAGTNCPAEVEEG